MRESMAHNVVASDQNVVLTRSRELRASSLMRGGEDDLIKVVAVDTVQMRRPERHIPDLDVFLRRLGNPGRYEVCVFFLLTLCYIVVAANNLGIIFMAREPSEYLCQDTLPLAQNIIIDINTTEWYVVEVLGGPLMNLTDRQQCTVTFDLPPTYYDELYMCTNWSFPQTDTGSEPRTIITSYGLVCQERHRIDIATTIYFLGLMIGAPIFGYLSDYYGRRVVILVSLSAAVILGVGTSFALSYPAFVALRFFLGLALQGTQVCFVLLVEWLPVNKRSLYGVLSQWIWSASVMFLALLGFIFPNWNDLQLATSLIGLLLVMAYFFFMKESIRWLILENRIDDASDSINRVLRTNHKASEMTWEMEHELVSIASYLHGQLPDEKPAYTFLDCFRPPGLRRTSICMMYIWFSCGIGYYGLFFATAPLVDNLAINVFINGLLELVPCLISLIVVPQYGRKQPMVIWSFLGGFACILSCLVRGSEPSMDAGRTALIIIGRMALSGSFCCFLIWTAELYPTVLRGNGIGVCMFALRLGGVLAPQLLSLAFVTFQEFPIILMGIIALGGVVAAYPLPETMNMNLPDTVAEAENFGSKPVRDTRRLRRLPQHGSISTLDGGSVRMSQISHGTGT